MGRTNNGVARGNTSVRREQVEGRCARVGRWQGWGHVARQQAGSKGRYRQGHGDVHGGGRGCGERCGKPGRRQWVCMVGMEGNQIPTQVR